MYSFISQTVFTLKANFNNNNNFLPNLSANYCIPGNVILIFINLNR